MSVAVAIHRMASSISDDGGAVREICELILKSQDKWDEATSRYFK